MSGDLTWSEQYRHPEWQRKRLEVLSAADFKCHCCGAVDQPLHVHHRRYVKGRMVWEYETKELDALCEACHAQDHVKRALLAELMATANIADPFGEALKLLTSALVAEYAVEHELLQRIRQSVFVDEEVGAFLWASATSGFPSVRLAALRLLIADRTTGPVVDGVLRALQESDENRPI